MMRPNFAVSSFRRKRAYIMLPSKFLRKALAMRTKSSRVGFTLVELLVVIGIIALLISILLPALSKARKQAMIITDLSNMRQVGLAVNMYANDNKGRLPGGYGNAGGYMHSHEIVRQRLYGETFDFGTLQSVKGGTLRRKLSCP